MTASGTRTARTACGCGRWRPRLIVGGADPVVETREVVYCGGGQERVRVRRGAVVVLERWTTHVSDGDRRVAVIDRHVIDTLANEVDAIGPARVRYHLTTPQGSTAVELDEAGQLISYEEYLPHGGSAFIAGDDVREVARRDVRYAGKERDRATGLDAYPQRYYAPWLGRWLSPDPIGAQGRVESVRLRRRRPGRVCRPGGNGAEARSQASGSSARALARDVPATAASTSGLEGGLHGERAPGARSRSRAGRAGQRAWARDPASTGGRGRRRRGGPRAPEGPGGVGGQHPVGARPRLRELGRWMPTTTKSSRQASLLSLARAPA
jgi:RHS repeat-associated protein